jgi:hypothetical protein
MRAVASPAASPVRVGTRARKIEARRVRCRRPSAWPEITACATAGAVASRATAPGDSRYGVAGHTAGGGLFGSPTNLPG